MFTFKSLSVLAIAVLMSPAAFSGYISLFNVEGESDLSAQYVTYNTLDDMLPDTIWPAERVHTQ